MLAVEVIALIKKIFLLQMVQQVLDNLLIAHIELRTDDSIDIQPYSHQRKVHKIPVALTDEIKYLLEKYLQVRICKSGVCLELLRLELLMLMDCHERARSGNALLSTVVREVFG